MLTFVFPYIRIKAVEGGEVMVTITKENLKALLVEAEESVDTEKIDTITLGCSGSCNNAKNMFFIAEPVSESA